MIPWNTSDQWDAVQQTLSLLIEQHDSKLSELIDKALSIKEHLNQIEEYLNCLCSKTCSCCPDPCCLIATLWYDFKDLLYLHLAGCEIPSAQPIKVQGQSCCYMTPKGCKLPRFNRPWICTQYFCGPQLSVMRKDGKNIKSEINNVVTKIKADREFIENQFIILTS